jgi:tetratricopeptide (TPR) repeat protein
MLQLMSRPPDERISRQIAGDICQRAGAKAVLAGSVSSLGTQYVLDLDALDCMSGDSLAHTQAAAERKEAVLAGLGRAATELRGRLGESIRSISRYNTPLEEATTPSLEALKAYTSAWVARNHGDEAASIPLFQRAIELDPNFALAYATVSAVYQNLGERRLALEYVRKAFEHREHASELEKLYITSHYYWYGGDPDKALDIFQVTVQEYPRDISAHINLGLEYRVRGNFDKAIEEEQNALRLDPDEWFPYGNLADVYLCLNRLDDAKAMVQQEIARKIDSPDDHVLLYDIAFLEHNEGATGSQLQWASGKPREFEMVLEHASAEASVGKLQSARQAYLRARRLALENHFMEGSSRATAEHALAESEFGNDSQARQLAKEAVANKPGALLFAALAFNSAGDTKEAETLVSQASIIPGIRQLAVVAPIFRASAALQQGKPQSAVELLRASPKLVSLTFPLHINACYLRGNLYLRAKHAEEARSEFQAILDHPGIAPVSPVHSLALLGLARAYRLAGDTSNARSAYQNFFARWKDADPDIPILRQAKAEYANLQ